MCKSDIFCILFRIVWFKKKEKTQTLTPTLDSTGENIVVFTAD